ncbi:hypothetical protein FQN60_015433, partial [Etheostoma spectabile]
MPRLTVTVTELSAAAPAAPPAPAAGAAVARRMEMPGGGGGRMITERRGFDMEGSGRASASVSSGRPDQQEHHSSSVCASSAWITSTEQRASIWSQLVISITKQKNHFIHFTLLLLGGHLIVLFDRKLVVEGQLLPEMTHLQTGLSPETLEKAKLELKENPETLHQDIQEVRDMIITRPDIGFLRTDDAFILRFLRARKFNHFEAFRLLAQYFEYRQQNLDMFKNLKATDPGIKQALKDGFPGVLSNLDKYGRKILVLFAANWDQSRYTFVDILRAILLSLESMIEDPELQVNGFILIIDWSNFTFKQASKLTPSMLRLAIEGLQ